MTHHDNQKNRKETRSLRMMRSQQHGYFRIHLRNSDGNWRLRSPWW